jgi:hypothetical protein
MTALGLVLRVVPLLFPCCAGTRRGQAQGGAAGRRGSPRCIAKNRGASPWRNMRASALIKPSGLSLIHTKQLHYIITKSTNTDYGLARILILHATVIDRGCHNLINYTGYFLRVTSISIPLPWTVHPRASQPRRAVYPTRYSRVTPLTTRISPCSCGHLAHMLHQGDLAPSEVFV